jgi:hypothetical protein
MSALTRSVRGSSNKLLYHVLEEPQLLAAVRELPAPVLVRLINHVGLEDAGELIALTSTQQLGQVFDAELWQSAEPGAEETFRPERFALYLQLLFEAGESFVVERLLALPRELLTLALHKLLLVIDIDATTVRFGAAGRFDDSIDRAIQVIDNAQSEEWEEFRLIARDASAFDDVWNALQALDREDHELVRSMIERCCDMDGELIEESGLYEVLNEEEALESDLVGERAGRRAAAGFIAPADARAFLELARRETLDETPDGRDAIARAYFRELAPQPGAKIRPGRALTSSARSNVTPDVERLLAVLREADVFEDDEPKPKRLLDSGGRRVDRALRDVAAAGPARSPKTAEGASPLAASTREETGRRLTLMAEAMLALREQSPSLHSQRSEELGFLANVLMAGSRHDGRTYRPVEAIECSLAVCSFGLFAEHGLRKHSDTPPTAAQAVQLLNELAADRLFRRGVYTLQVQLGDRARAHIAHLLGITLQNVPAAVRGGTASLLPELALDTPDAIALAALAEPEPWLAGCLAAPDHLFIANELDLESAQTFLADLEHTSE